jgi:hypothetical protein
MRRLVSRSAFIILWIVASAFLALGARAQLQTEMQMATALIDQVALANNIIALSSPESTQEELPGMGHKFELFGAMMDDVDPMNPTNGTVSATMTPTVVAVAFRNLPPGIKITALDTQLGLKYFFEAPRTCGAGSPRVSLLVDSDGDGSTNFVAHGHVNPPVFAACLQGEWIYENLTDNLKRWEVTPATALTPACGPVGGPTTCTWDELEARITAQFPNHKILGGFLVEDSCSFFPATCGKAHYDLVTIENRTLENKQDTVRNNN